MTGNFLTMKSQDLQFAIKAIEKRGNIREFILMLNTDSIKININMSALIKQNILGKDETISEWFQDEDKFLVLHDLGILEVKMV